ncbi:hypothetical protein D3C78_1917690 [compost metagenome]
MAISATTLPSPFSFTRLMNAPGKVSSQPTRMPTFLGVPGIRFSFSVTVVLSPSQYTQLVESGGILSRLAWRAAG